MIPVEPMLEHRLIYPTSKEAGRVICEPLPEDTTTEADAFLWEWLEWLTNSTDNCLGLAANQIGFNVNAFHLQMTDEDEPRRFRNPVIVRASKRKRIFKDEGCMSFPGQYVDTERHEWVEVKDDINGTQVYKGLLGICVQHEIDHLNGTLHFDRKAHSTYISKGNKIGRNDPCPYCLELGREVKYKKCKDHFNA